jgi:hypothetical protein
VSARSPVADWYRTVDIAAYDEALVAPDLVSYAERVSSDFASSSRTTEARRTTKRPHRASCRTVPTDEHFGKPLMFAADIRLEGR